MINPPGRSFTADEKGLRGGGIRGLMGRWVDRMMGEMARRHRAGEGQRGGPATRGTNMKMRNGRFSGTLRNEVYVNSPDGQIVRSRPRRRPRPTTARLRVQGNLARVARLWRKCKRLGKHKAWETAGKKVKMKGYRLFCQINGALADADEPLVMDPPKFEKIKPNPVGELEILNRGGVITLRLRVARAPAKLTFVLGVRWCSAGLSVPRSNYVILGRLPEAVGGWSDITDLYVKKYGAPPADWQVFIATRQLINGRKDTLKKTDAIVPQPEGQGGLS
jgi:hypothetical protein